MKILNQTLYTDQEIIKSINSKFGDNTLNRSMFTYMRDIRGLIPKPIRIKSDDKVGGARSYYLEDTLNALNKIMEEYSKVGKSLKEIQTQYNKLIEQTMLATETFRKQFEELNNILKETGEKIRNAYGPAFKQINEMFQKNMPRIEKQAWIQHFEETLKALKQIGGEEKANKLIEEMVVMYNQRLKFRVRQQTEQANLKK